MYTREDFESTDPLYIFMLVMGIVAIVLWGVFGIMVEYASTEGDKLAYSQTQFAESKVEVHEQNYDSLNDLTDDHIVIEQWDGGKTYSVDENGNETVLLDNNGTY